MPKLKQNATHKTVKKTKNSTVTKKKPTKPWTSKSGIINGVQQGTMQLPANSTYTFENGTNQPVLKKLLQMELNSIRVEVPTEETDDDDEGEGKTEVQHVTDIQLMKLMQLKQGENCGAVFALKRSLVIKGGVKDKSTTFFVAASNHDKSHQQKFDLRQNQEFSYNEEFLRDKNAGTEYKLDNKDLLPSYYMTSTQPFVVKVYVSLMMPAIPITTGVVNATFKSYEDCDTA